MTELGRYANPPLCFLRHPTFTITLPNYQYWLFGNSHDERLDLVSGSKAVQTTAFCACLREFPMSPQYYDEVKMNPDIIWSLLRVWWPSILFCVVVYLFGKWYTSRRNIDRPPVNRIKAIIAAVLIAVTSGIIFDRSDEWGMTYSESMILALTIALIILFVFRLSVFR